jgi:hypothetical protein
MGIGFARLALHQSCQGSHVRCEHLLPGGPMQPPQLLPDCGSRIPVGLSTRSLLSRHKHTVNSAASSVLAFDFLLYSRVKSAHYLKVFPSLTSKTACKAFALLIERSSFSCAPEDRPVCEWPAGLEGRQVTALSIANQSNQICQIQIPFCCATAVDRATR